MLTSARNQFSGTIKELNIGAVNAEVIIGLKGRQRDHYRVDHQRLGREPWP